jgi:hypothetical protein
MSDRILAFAFQLAFFVVKIRSGKSQCEYIGRRLTQRPAIRGLHFSVSELICQFPSDPDSQRKIMGETLANLQGFRASYGIG